MPANEEQRGGWVGARVVGSFAGDTLVVGVDGVGYGYGGVGHGEDEDFVSYLGGETEEGGCCCVALEAMRVSKDGLIPSRH